MTYNMLGGTLNLAQLNLVSNCGKWKNLSKMIYFVKWDIKLN